jgi:hypothetical protein
MDATKRSFAEMDELRGWPLSTTDSRMTKCLRKGATLTARVLPNKFISQSIVTLPKPFLVDPAADAVTISQDRGDIYEAFRRTSEVSIRGVFANGEVVWGTATYRSGITYTGSFSGSVPDGFGEKHAGDSVYKGRFKNGSRHGRGLLLDSKKFRLFMGMFIDDRPQGEFLMITFGWSGSKRCTYTHTCMVTFDVGEVVKKTLVSKVDKPTVYCGLEDEEFLELFRKCEGFAEQEVGRKRLSQMKAEECLWEKTCVYPYAQ